MSALKEYAIDDVTNDDFWYNSKSCEKIPRNEFRNLKRHFESDLKRGINHTLKLQQQNGLDIKKHYCDKQMFLVIALVTEMLKFQNKLSLNQCVQLMKVMMKHLTPINQKLFFVKITSWFDWVDPLTHQRLDKIKDELLKTADYTEEDYHKRYDLFYSFTEDENGCWNEDLVKREEWVANPTIKKVSVDEDLELIKNNDWVTAYRGFVIHGDRPIRLVKKDEKEFVAKGDDFPYHKLQNASYGVSYTFDKFVAHFFAFYGEQALRHNMKMNGKDTSNIRAVVGKYHIRTADIFVYNNERQEREIVLRNASRGKTKSCFPLLEHYEFFTDGSGNFNKTGGYSDVDDLRPKMPDFDYSSDRKIMRVM